MLNVSQVLPVNRLFTVDAGQPTPDLKCVVGFHSIEEEVSIFLAVQDSSIGDLVTHSLINSVSHLLISAS